MNGPHDLGGQAGFGPVAPEPDEPVFHAPWERRALALTIAAGAMRAWSIDESRHARESLHPADYYASSYYAIWIKAPGAAARRATASSAEAELAARPRRDAGRPPEAGAARRRGAGRRSPAAGPATATRPGAPAAFAAGDAVRTRVMHPPGHTRLPRYARGKRGRIAAVQGFFVLPDSNAHGRGEAPEWLYTVRLRRRPSSGAATPTRRAGSRSTPGRATLSPPELPGLPRDAEGAPVFPEPWAARAFALAVGLHERGAFAWPEFSAALAEARARDPDGDYFAAWLAALEAVLARRASRRRRRSPRCGEPGARPPARRRTAGRSGSKTPTDDPGQAAA